MVIKPIRVHRYAEQNTQQFSVYYLSDYKGIFVIFIVNSILEK